MQTASHALKSNELKAELTQWLEETLSTELGLPIEEVRKVRRFDELGVDSVLASFISASLGDRLNRAVDPNILYEFLDIDSLADALAS